jgi:prevent-host-death family protein
MDVNVHEAKTHLSRLLRQVDAGEEITISRAGRPVAKLIAAKSPNKLRPMGMDRGRIRMADDFDKADPQLEALFYASVTTETATQKPARRTKTTNTKKKL